MDEGVIFTKKNVSERKSNGFIYPIEVEKSLILIDKLLASVPFYRLRCNMDPEAADVSYNGMQE